MCVCVCACVALGALVMLLSAQCACIIFFLLVIVFELLVCGCCCYCYCCCCSFSNLFVVNFHVILKVRIWYHNKPLNTCQYLVNRSACDRIVLFWNRENSNRFEKLKAMEWIKTHASNIRMTKKSTHTHTGNNWMTTTNP